MKSVDDKEYNFISDEMENSPLEFDNLSSRSQRVLMMVYTIKITEFLDFILRSVFYKTRENDFSENGYVSVFK
jgi:hypothetical protein